MTRIGLIPGKSLPTTTTNIKFKHNRGTSAGQKGGSSHLEGGHNSDEEEAEDEEE